VTYNEYTPQFGRKEKKNNVYQPHCNNIHQLYNMLPDPCSPSLQFRRLFAHKFELAQYTLQDNLVKMTSFPVTGLTASTFAITRPVLTRNYITSWLKAVVLCPIN
jgi:hypothetical protein